MAVRTSASTSDMRRSRTCFSGMRMASRTHGVATSRTRWTNAESLASVAEGSFGLPAVSRGRVARR